MHRDRSLTDLIQQRHFTSRPELAERQVAALAKVVAQASRPLPKSGWDWPRFVRGVALPSSSLALATKTYSQVLEQGRNNPTRLEETRLGAMALSASPAMVRFWTSLLELKRLRDTFAKERRCIAVTALALVVFEHSAPLARAALLDATRHESEETRAAAAEALVQAFILNRK
jgi:hypothetical protein